MASLTHTVGGDSNLVSFKSAARVPITSLKAHFLPVQEGEGDPSPDNVRPIRGWNEVEIHKNCKNIAHIIGYSATSNNSPSDSRYLTNSYGTTLSTIDYALPDTSVTIVQSQASETENTTSYKNGYVNIIIDNLIFNQNYDISFKITDIKNNPLNISLQTIRLMVPSGGSSAPSEIQGNCLIFKNIKYLQNSSIPNRRHFSIRICGMSFTLSEFMVTPANMNDGKWEPYCGEQIPITFPVLGKNKFNWDVEFTNPDITATTSASKRIFQPYTYCIGGSYSNYFMPIAIENYNIENGIISVKRKAGYSVYGVSYALPLISGQTYYLSCTAVSGFIHTAFYDKEGNYLTGSSNNYSNFSFTVPNNAVISVFNFIPSNTTDIATFSNIQIELGSTATEYTEFSDNNTVYGGYIDITKGELVAEWINKSVLWGDIKNNNPNSTTNIDSGFIYFDEPIIYTTAGANATNSFCNVGKYVFSGKDYNSPHFYPGTRNGITCSEIYLPSNTDNNTLVQTVVKLLNPIHYPLSKTELQTFLNQNNIWSNTNDITEVSYAIHDSAPIRAAKHRIAAAEPHIATVSGSLAHFQTDIIAPIKNAKIYFNPVQEGSGDPSPSNIRNITGWTSVETSYMKKNLFDINFFKNAEDVTVDGNTFSGYVSPIHQVTYKKLMPMKIPKGSVFTTKAIAYRSVSDIGAGWSFWFVYANGERVRPFYTNNSVTTPTEYKGTLTAAEDIIGLDFGYYNQAATGIWYVSNVQIEINSSDTEYEKYNGNTIPINWENNYQTIYGGYIDLIKGVLVQTHKKVTIGELSWRTVPSLGEGGWTTDSHTPSDMSRTATPISTIYKTINWQHSWSSYQSEEDYGISRYSPSDNLCIVIKDSRYSTVADFIAAQSNTEIIYELATPIEYSLTPTQLKTLRGTNNIWSNSNGDITVQFWRH